MKMAALRVHYFFEAEMLVAHILEFVYYLCEFVSKKIHIQGKVRLYVASITLEGDGKYNLVLESFCKGALRRMR